MTPETKTGDIVAVYIQLRESALLQLPSLATIANLISGADITVRAVDTDNVQGGRVGKRYSIALGIGTPAANKNDIQLTSLVFNTPGLRLDDIEAIAVRVTSVGPWDGSRNPQQAGLFFSGSLSASDSPSFTGRIPWFYLSKCPIAFR